MRLMLLVPMLILLAGCASQNAPPPAPPAQQHVETPPEKPVSTPNLSFSREPAGEVITPETKFPEVPAFNFSKKTADDGRLIVYYFKSSGCIACRELQPEMDKLQSKYPGVDWHTYDILTQNGTWAYQAFAQEYNLSTDKRLVPQVLVNGTIITDRFNINQSLEGLLIRYGAS